MSAVKFIIWHVFPILFRYRMYDEDFDEPCTLISSSVNRTVLSSTAAAAATEFLAGDLTGPKITGRPEE